jgi:dipeptidase
MCDILYVPPAGSRNASVLFAKNSDREPDEIQLLEFVPRHSNPTGQVQCTYVSIPWKAPACACLISRPFQMYGAEMGINEHGVVIGNEAVFTRIKFNKSNPGLTGMDMIRLALQSSATAAQALECIIQLLEQYGQDACGGYRNKNFYYHNSFLVADAHQAFVLETAGREWAIEKVTSVRSLSNCLTIGLPHQSSARAIALAQSKGWHKKGRPFHFAKSYSDKLYTWLSRGAIRARHTCTAINTLNRPVTVHDCMVVLQSHNLPDPAFRPSRANTASVCMHATGLLNPSETTASMVAEIRKDKPHTVWFTATPHPCLSVFIPLFISENILPQNYPLPNAGFWQKAAQIHNWILKDYPQRKPKIEQERQRLQQSFLEEEARLINQHTPAETLHAFSRNCLEQVIMAYEKWSTTFY